MPVETLRGLASELCRGFKPHVDKACLELPIFLGKFLASLCVVFQRYKNGGQLLDKRSGDGSHSVERFHKRTGLPVEDLGNLVEDFVDFLISFLVQQSVFRGGTPTSKARLGRLVVMVIMVVAAVFTAHGKIPLQKVSFDP